MNKAILLAALAGLAITAQAAVVNVNFTNDPVAQKLDGSSWSATVSPLSYTGTRWNDTKYNYSGDVAGNPLNNLIDSQGAASGVGFNLSSWDSVAADWTGITLLRGGFWSSRTMTLTIKGLSQSTQYDLYLEGNASNSHSSTFTIGSQSLVTSATSNSSFIEGDNYVHFSNVGPDGSGNIVVSISAGPKGVRVIDGFQISAVPEPGALAVLGLSGLTMLRRKRS